jgi:hypothetical protein
MIASGVMLPGARLAAPPDLTPAERDQWEVIIGAVPPGFISAEQVHLLRLLCQHICYSAQIAGAIKRCEPGDDPKMMLTLRRLMTMHSLQTSQISVLSQKLRLTNTARHSREKTMTLAKRRAVGPKPWEDWGTPEPQSS